MKTSFFILCFLISIYIEKTNGQTKLGLPDQTIHSPTVRDFGQYHLYPVDKNTGVPQIDVPLHTIKSGRLEVPISLSYHASGIKVDQEATPIGLGWSLRAGGAIVRIVNDKPDESGPEGFKISGQSLPDYNSITDPEVTAGAIGNSIALQTQRMQDNQPDLFMVTLPGLQFEFCFDNQGNIAVKNKEAYKVQTNFADNLITVTDKTGNLYRFGKSLNGTSCVETTQQSRTSYSSESSTVTPMPSGTSVYVSSWFLTEIISADKADTIQFKYKASYYSASSATDVTRFFLPSSPALPSTDQGGVSFDGMNTTVTQTTIPDLRIIEQILFKGGSVSFSVANDRQDIVTDVAIPSRLRITGLVVRNMFDQEIKKAVFESDYFNRDGIGQPIVYSAYIEPHRKKALKLQAVHLFGSNNASEGSYSFEYDGTLLPPFNTTAQDFWGYNNGVSNTSLIPGTFHGTFNGKPVYLGSNRDANFNYMRAASLIKVTYPSKGYTTFEYEPNYYLSTQGQNSQVERSRVLSASAINRLGSCDPELVMPGVGDNTVVDFTISEALSSPNGRLVISFSDFKIYGGTPMRVKLTDLTTGQIFQFEQGTATMGARKVVDELIPLTSMHSYRLESRTNGVTGSDLSLCNSPFIDVSLTYNYLETVTDPGQILPKQAGGLRIKNMVTYSSIGLPAKKMSYEYGDQKYGPLNVTTGQLLTEPSKNFFFFPLLYQMTPNTKQLANVVWFSSNSNAPLSAQNGCPVVYDKVIERIQSFENSQAVLGKTEYYYTASKRYHEPRAGRKFPYEVYIYPSWGAPELSSVIHYKIDPNQQYVPIQKVEYGFTDMPESRIKTVVIDDLGPELSYAYRQNDGNWSFNENPERFYYYNHYVSLGRRLKTSETTTDYMDGLPTITSQQTLNYNQHLDISEVSRIDSRKNTAKIKYQYTGDFGNSNWLAANMLSLPVREEHTLDNTVQTGVIIDYDLNGNPTAKFTALSAAGTTFLPYSNSQIKPNYYQIEEQITYYEQSKKVKTRSNIYGLPTTFLWSCSDQNPCIVVEGASYSEIENVLGAGRINSLRTEFPTTTDLNILRALLQTQLNGVSIQTYSYNVNRDISAQTDAKGQTIYYEYDELQRLKTVKDQDGNVLNSYTYHYKN